MIYLLLVLSLILNGVLVWYVRKVLTKFWDDVETRKDFTQMLTQYEESLSQLYKLEEFYGEETLKKAIQQTKFVVEACKEFQEILQKDTSAEEGEESPDQEEVSEEDKVSGKEDVIRLKEGEKVTQDAASYKRVIREIS